MNVHSRHDRRLARASARERLPPSRAARAVQDAAPRAFTRALLSTKCQKILAPSRFDLLSVFSFYGVCATEGVMRGGCSCEERSTGSLHSLV